MNARGDAVESTRYRGWVRDARGKWRTDPAPDRFIGPGDGALLPPVPLPRDPGAEAAASEAMRAWLAALDRRDLGACWAAASEAFRGGLQEPEWRARATDFARRLGTSRGRRELAREYGPLPEAPTQRFVTIEYRSDYSLAGSVVEGLTAVPCGGAWCVMGWGAR